ncbi:hypothetical protein VTK56DRAFT_6173 [Thermocarpiscus australiensis]
MASFVQAVLRLASSRRRQPRFRPDVEQATTAGSVAVSSTLGGGYSSLPPQSQHQTAGHPAARDDLTLFRLMVGISTSPDLAGSGASGAHARPADNIGLYARVVHSEQVAKDSYKVMSAVINACYGLQIIVAAALTSLGAANADNKAITAFGAVNTIIAGFLTYLKGSGLPGRLKYFGNEWKKVREYIEQRERDFSHGACALDVYEVVETVRDMYEKTRRDVELNAPEGYNSVSSARNAHVGGGGGEGLSHLPGVDPAKADEVAGKLRTLEETIQKLRARAEKTVHGVHGEAEHTKAHVEKMAGDVHDAAAHTILDEEKRATAELRSLGRAAMQGVEEQKQRRAREVAREVSQMAQASPGLDVSVRVSPRPEDGKDDGK